MKRKAIYLGAVLVCAVAIGGYALLQPPRLTAGTLEKARQVQQQLDEKEMKLAQAQNPAPATPPAPAAPAPAPAAQPEKKDANMFKVKFECSNGNFVVEVHRDWAPLGAARFEDLVKQGFYNGCRFFRVVPGFVVQFGINGDPALNTKWRTNTIKDDLVKESNKLGTLTFATSGPNTRTTQLFINLADNASLDGQGFAPFGKVTQGMDVVRTIFPGYGQRPDQNMIQTQGNSYLESQFPKMDYIKTATIIE